MLSPGWCVDLSGPECSCYEMVLLPGTIQPINALGFSYLEWVRRRGKPSMLAGELSIDNPLNSDFLQRVCNTMVPVCARTSELIIY